MSECIISLGAHVSQSETAQFACGKHAGHANARAGTQGEKGNSLRSHSPLSLGSLPRAPSFLILLPLKGGAPCFDKRNIFARSQQEGKG